LSAEIPEEERWMRRALALAEQGFTPPNPMVGCVIVKDGEVVGEGFHPYAGEPHAEVFALRAAGENAKGATAYVNLEPCSHFGRTPPCAQALIDAGVARVVAASTDPNPNVSGHGFEMLWAAGIEVETGLLEEDARRLNEAFFHFQTTRRPFITLKAAMTLDGKIATRTGDSKWITGEESRSYVHRLRAQSGAVLCGVGTVIADDPLLTARLPGGVPRQPLRIVLDPHLRTPLKAKLVQTAPKTPTLLVTSSQAPRDKSDALASAGVEVLVLPHSPDGLVDISALMDELGRREIISVLVEGGGKTHAAFLAAQQAHRLLWFIAPKLVGGESAPSPLEGEGVARMADAVMLSDVTTRAFGDDILVSGIPQFSPV
jgi:diaminohydroxyphosphoribosylaminopyrimidine deaminase/5-amino-6-(5-phosphoribosylamino)uracil reductase